MESTQLQLLGEAIPYNPIQESPELKLMRAVLCLAVRDYLMGTRSERLTAQHYLFEKKRNKEEYIYSYENICFYLKIDAELLKEKILNFNADKTKIFVTR